MRWGGQPGLHRTVTLTAQVTSQIQASDLRLRWSAPAGVSLCSPASESLGPIAAGQTVTRHCDLTFNQAGSFKVAVSAQVTGEGLPGTFGDADVLFFAIRRGWGSHVSRRGPGISSVRERIDAPDAQTAATIEPAAPEAGFSVTGRVMYEDIPLVTSTGPLPGIDVPARQVKVEIWEEDRGLPDDHEGTTRTGDDGYFSFWVPDNDDGAFDTDGKEIYLRVYPDTPGGYVTDRGAVDQRYRLETGILQGGQDIDFGELSPATFDPMFNISDVLLDGYRYISQFRSPPHRVKVRFEPDYDPVVMDGSYYETVLERINLSGETQDPDGYDDSVILHEYGHFLADQYACDDSFGGAHDVDRHYNKRLAWSEGWANYLASAVQNSPYYLNWNWNGGWSNDINWEGWSVTGSTNEGAVCATLWDIHDSADETHDVLSLGGSQIWYTFQEHMGGSVPVSWTDCNIDAFWDGWHEAGFPDDSELAAIFAHHQTAGQTVKSANQTAGQVPAAVPQPLDKGLVDADVADEPGSPMQPAAVTAPDTVLRGEVPWNAVLFLVDATASMAGEVEAVRQIVQNQVSDMDAGPDPYEYIVETFQDTGVNSFVADHFFPDVVNPPVDGISVGGGGDAAEDSFAALARGIADRAGYDAWVLTDAVPKYEVSSAELEGLLQSRAITPYFFLFGDCSGQNLADAGALGETLRQPSGPGRLHLPRFEPAGLEECIEPYLLAANSANGQLLLVDTSQIDDAAEIVRAFMNNNAGAGRYADYVSSSYTYSWDETDYDWYDATGGDRHNYCYQDRAAVALQQPFSFYGTTYYTAYASRSGYVAFSDFGDVTENTGIPTTALPNNAVYAFWDEIWDLCIPKREAPSQGVGVYTDYDAVNNRYAIEYHDFRHVGTTDVERFEILLDFATGEIIVQYAQVTDDSSCTIGVENASGSSAAQVSYNQAGTLQTGQAIKFTPMPPQPTRDHDVLVDSSMDSVIFLLNGYSGSVDITLLQPGGTPVDPGDPDVTFLDVGKIKYYQVTHPEAGTWIARVSGEGTYYFTSSAASALAASYEGDPTLNTDGTNTLTVDLGMAVASAAFSLVYPDGSFFDSLDLYDDGAHGDGGADDGLYGGTYQAPGPGTVYLQVDGQTSNGEGYRRTDLTPIRFQEMLLVASVPTERFAMPGETVTYDLWLGNFDSTGTKCFSLDLESTQGWASLSDTDLCVAPSGFEPFTVAVEVPPGAERVVEQTMVTAQAWNGEMADGAAVATTVRGPVAHIDLAAYPERIAPDGQQAIIVAQVADVEGWNVADGTLVTFGTTLGTVDPLVGATTGGMVTATLTSGGTTGTAWVQAAVGSGAVNETVAVEISSPLAYGLTVEASPDHLPPDGVSTSTLTAHVYDLYGDAAPDGTEIVFVVDGDDMLMGSIEGGEAYTATTVAGAAPSTYRGGTTLGWATIRAEIPPESPSGEGESTGGIRWAETHIRLGAAIYLPIVQRQQP
jgi:hypothetical protein